MGEDLWLRYQRRLCVCDEIGLRLDFSRMACDDAFFERMAGPLAKAFGAMAALEAGAIANPDEGRRVGHYWLRAPELAPSADLRDAIEDALARIRAFAADVHAGRLAAPDGQPFSDLLVIGIGGSALGPQLVADALGDPRRDKLRPHFLDNSDPDGMARALARLGDDLARTLVVVISKSGATPETRNGMLVVKAACARRGLDFARLAVAITGDGSQLDRQASAESWLARFPMWDWVGGRTSETSAVGLLPAALQGLDIDGLLAGARACDEVTRRPHLAGNPAAHLALLWYHATDGRGARDMVLLPYKDRLLLFSRYLQQLIMESLGKGRDLDGNEVAQGIAVYGNKGSTDQHAYVQQLREGIDNFFVTFLQIQADVAPDADPESRVTASLEVEPGITSGDYLRGFLLGTREALWAAGRQSLTLSLDQLDAPGLGVLIALYERAVGLYASLIHVNAYHQPGVEAGKKAAAGVLELQLQVLGALREQPRPQTVAAVAVRLGLPERRETIFHLLEGLVANGRALRIRGANPFDDSYRAP
jgi:glucose-6-phosphate isomerase